MKQITKFKRLLSGVLSAVITISAIPFTSATAEDSNEPYPYTMFAASSDEGAIIVNADNFCVNGNVATNGTIVSSGNVNINGSRTENAEESMIYIFNKIDNQYFSASNVDEHDEDYTLDEMNININVPTEVQGKATLTGNININTALKALEDVNLNGEVKNTNDSVIFSKYGDIIIDSQNVNLNGLVYAPFGNVNITAQNLNLNNLVIIADSIVLTCPSVNANNNSNASSFVGTTSEPLDIPYDEWQYMKDENENDFPDFFEDFNNWEKLKDTDGDSLPDCVEQYLGTDYTLVDTDGDMLDDFYEVFFTKTDPTMADSDENGVSDGDEDLDDDGLINFEELSIGTHPLYPDTDGDSLMDGDEVNLYYTNPLVTDTDSDGLTDDDEILLFDTNPLIPDTDGNGILDGNEKRAQKYSYVVTNEDCAVKKIDVEMSATGNIQRNLDIESVMNIDLMSTNVVGLIGEPFDFNCSSDFDNATITFNVDISKLGDTKFESLIFLWHDEENHIYRELPTSYDNENYSLTTTVNHFSKYMIVDKELWYAAWAEDLYESDNETSGNNTVLIIDCSGSMRNNDPMINGTCGRIEAAKGFVNVSGSNDYIAIIAEDSQAKLLCDFVKADEKEVLNEAISKIYSTGGNNFISSLNMGVDMLNKLNNENAKNIIFMSDGGSSIDQNTLDYIKESNVNVITIGYGESSNDYLLKRIATSDDNFYKAISSNELIELYSKLGIMKKFDMTDNDEDGLADIFEIAGMRLENGTVIYTNPLEKDSDKDNLADGVEIVPEYQFLSGSGIPSDILYGTRAIYFILNSDPNKNEGQISDYGIVEYDGYYYCINVPDHLGTYWNAVWEEVDVKEYSDFDWTLIQFFAGVELEDTRNEPIYPGGNRLDIPIIYPSKYTAQTGIAGLFAGLLCNSANIGESFRVRFCFQKSGNMRRVTIAAGSSSIYNLYQTYATDMPISGYLCNGGSVFAQAMISNSASKQYEELTGNKTSIWDTYDYEITVDSRHQSYYSSYLWVNSEGKLMEKLILYPNDRIVIGKREYLNVVFKPLIQVGLSNESTEASSKYQELFNKFLAA